MDAFDEFIYGFVEMEYDFDAWIQKASPAQAAAAIRSLDSYVREEVKDF